MQAMYFPIFKAKDAEFDALHEAKQHIASSMIPLFDVPKFNPELKKYQNDSHAKATFLSEISTKIGKLRFGMPVMFDTYHWQHPNERVESGEHHLSYLYNTLKSDGVIAIPVVGYDRWDDEEYRLALRSIARNHSGKFCIRLDRFAFEDINDPEHFHDRFSEIIDSLEIIPANCHVILDLQDLSEMAIPDMICQFDSLFLAITDYGFATYSVAGCSLPNSIDKAVKQKDSTGSLLRREMVLWKYAREHYPAHQIHFGDYGVRGPSATEIGYGNTNAKIRYTIDNEYFIVRGHKIEKPIGGFQHCALARILMDSKYYLSPDFSWGDNEIKRCSENKLGGGATTWIKIDTSHHVAYVVLEIAEFERNRVSKALNLA